MEMYTNAPRRRKTDKSKKKEHFQSEVFNFYFMSSSNVYNWPNCWTENNQKNNCNTSFKPISPVLHSPGTLAILRWAQHNYPMTCFRTVRWERLISFFCWMMKMMMITWLKNISYFKEKNRVLIIMSSLARVLLICYGNVQT